MYGDGTLGPAIQDRRDGGGTGTRPAGEGFTGATFPGALVDLMTIEPFNPLNIGTLRKLWMVFERWSIAGYRELAHVFDGNYAVGVTHGQARGSELAVSGCELLPYHLISFAKHRNLLPPQTGHAHIDFHLLDSAAGDA
jgi:hypothetical protein